MSDESEEGEGKEGTEEGLYGKFIIIPATHLLRNHAHTGAILYFLYNK